jgi:hypothetical protein
VLSFTRRVVGLVFCLVASSQSPFLHHHQVALLLVIASVGIFLAILPVPSRPRWPLAPFPSPPSLLST